MRYSALTLLFLAGTAVAAEPDPYATKPNGPVEVLLRAATFGEPDADAAIERWLVAHPQAKPEDRARLFERLCTDYGALGRNALRAPACKADKEDSGLSGVLRNEPDVRGSGSARVPLILNSHGSRSVEVVANGVAAPWYFDTGAEVSVISQTLADRIGVRRLEGSFKVGTTTAPVHGAMGIVPLLQIGGARVENLPVLILPDAQLTIGPMPTIPAILGLPAMVALGRIAWIDHGATLLLGDAAPAVPNGTRIHWHEEGLGIPISAHGKTLAAFFDSGANHTGLRAQGHALLDAPTEASAVEKTVRTGGAGGIVESKQQEYPRVPLSVAGTPLTFVDVNMKESDQRSAAQVGDDLIAQLSVLAIDFRSMRIAAKP